jgi:hypothetical protein
VSGSIELAALNSFASRALIIWRRWGAPIKYTTRATGPKPYRKNVTIAPRTVPFVLVASAIAIIRATYNQAIGTIYIDESVNIRSVETMSGFQRDELKILGFVLISSNKEESYEAGIS